VNESNLILLRKELARDEGVRYEAYQDTLGLWTIGYGHLLGLKKRLTEITFSEAEALLDSDIKQAQQIVRHLVQQATSGDTGKMLGASRERALINMAFNLGPGLTHFKKFLAAVNVNDWATAAVEMMQSKWAVQVGDRAKRLRDMILTDD